MCGLTSKSSLNITPRNTLFRNFPIRLDNVRLIGHIVIVIIPSYVFKQIIIIIIIICLNKEMQALRPPFSPADHPPKGLPWPALLDA